MAEDDLKAVLKGSGSWDPTGLYERGKAYGIPSVGLALSGFVLGVFSFSLIGLFMVPDVTSTVFLWDVRHQEPLNAFESDSIMFPNPNTAGLAIFVNTSVACTNFSGGFTPGSAFQSGLNWDDDGADDFKTSTSIEPSDLPSGPSPLHDDVYSISHGPLQEVRSSSSMQEPLVIFPMISQSSFEARCVVGEEKTMMVSLYLWDFSEVLVEEGDLAVYRSKYNHGYHWQIPSAGLYEIELQPFIANIIDDMYSVSMTRANFVSIAECPDGSNSEICNALQGQTILRITTPSVVQVEGGKQTGGALGPIGSSVALFSGALQGSVVVLPYLFVFFGACSGSMRRRGGTKPVGFCYGIDSRVLYALAWSLCVSYLISMGSIVYHFFSEAGPLQRKNFLPIAAIGLIIVSGVITSVSLGMTSVCGVGGYRPKNRALTSGGALFGALFSLSVAHLVHGTFLIICAIAVTMLWFIAILAVVAATDLDSPSLPDDSEATGSVGQCGQCCGRHCVSVRDSRVCRTMCGRCQVSQEDDELDESLLNSEMV